VNAPSHPKKIVPEMWRSRRQMDCVPEGRIGASGDAKTANRTHRGHDLPKVTKMTSREANGRIGGLALADHA
jgi:hypothetical protein